MHTLVGIAIGFLGGCFCPAVARKVKALFVKEGNAAKAAVPAAVAAEVKKVL